VVREEGVNASEMLRHGYTLAALEEMASRAALGIWNWTVWPYGERKGIARFTIAEHLLTCEYRPDFWSLVRLAKRAIQAELYHDANYRGVSLARNSIDPTGVTYPSDGAALEQPAPTRHTPPAPGHAAPGGAYGRAPADPVAASIRDGAVDRMVRMSARHAAHAWRHRRDRAVVPHALAFLYADPMAPAEDGRQFFTVVAATRMVNGRVQVSGATRFGTRAIRRKLDCLKPSLQTTQYDLRRKRTPETGATPCGGIPVKGRMP
jgi:hypothetical protein